jgi:hypothetical protein
VDLLRAEQPLGDHQRADRVVGEDSARVVDHVGVALLQAEDAGGDQACVHAREHRDLAARLRQQLALVKARGVIAGVCSRSSVALTVWASSVDLAGWAARSARYTARSVYPA